MSQHRFDDQGFEEVVEVNCLITIKDGQAKVFALTYDESLHKWRRQDITDMLPLEEALRIQALATSKRQKFFHKLGKEKGLRW